MRFSQPGSGVYIPDNLSAAEGFARTTHLGVGAHPDDLEFMAWYPILECFEAPDLWFSGVICSDGRSSPRAGHYAEVSDDEMVKIRSKEQRHAASTARVLSYQIDQPNTCSKKAAACVASGTIKVVRLSMFSLMVLGRI